MNKLKALKIPTIAILIAFSMSACEKEKEKDTFLTQMTYEKAMEKIYPNVKWKDLKAEHFFKVRERCNQLETFTSIQKKNCEQNKHVIFMSSY